MAFTYEYAYARNRTQKAYPGIKRGYVSIQIFTRDSDRLMNLFSKKIVKMVFRLRCGSADECCFLIIFLQIFLSFGARPFVPYFLHKA